MSENEIWQFHKTKQKQTLGTLEIISQNIFAWNCFHFFEIFQKEKEPKKT